MQTLPFESFYLTAITPQGVVSRTKGLLSENRFSKVILLKGAPPEVTSEFLNCAAEAAAQRGFEVKTALSAIDDGYIEAVFWGDTAVVNGSSPFNIDPPFFGSKFKTLWLGDLADRDKSAQNQAELLQFFLESQRQFESARKLLFAADCLLSDNRRTAFEAADQCKIKIAAEKSAAKMISGKGKEQFFITADRLGGKGMENSLLGYEVTAFKDKYGGCAELFLSLIHKAAKRCGCRFIAGFSPLYPYAFPELLIFPDSKKAVVYADGSFKLDRSPDRVITARRFTDKGQLTSRKRLLDANRKAAEKLLSRSEELFLGAAAARNEISRVAVGGQAADGQLRQQLFRRLSDLCFFHSERQD
ncbi:MAG: hypothetical protein IJF25_03235 [Oscillospiraceae bacterium]|nr:hypothetical protein [Oscillospiraceae bacterium]MBQ4539013.1 hypothetical protein [Oscillospiraceae bacterium]